jgi:putative copper resistance protein D
MLDAGLFASRFLHFVALLALFGASLYPLYAFRDRLASIEEEQAFVARLRRMLLFTLAGATLGGVGWFVFTTGAMAGDLAQAFMPAVLRTMMVATDFGPLFAARLVLAVLIAALLWRWPRLPFLWLVPLLAGLLLASLAATGHGRVGGGTVHIASDGVHLLAAGLWLGGLWPLGWAITSAFQSSRTSDDLAIARTLQRFSGVATLNVAILIASGLVNGLYLVGSVGALFSSRYGWLLVAKVALFLIMILLASLNRFWITPRLADSPSPGLLGRLRWHVLAEQLLGLTVLALVAVLGTLELPSGG